MKNKGWRRQPSRHALAAKGLRTRIEKFKIQNKKRIAAKPLKKKDPTDDEMDKMYKEVGTRADALEDNIYEIANLLNKIGDLSTLADNLDMDFDHELMEMTAAIYDVRIKEPLDELMEDIVYVEMNSEKSLYDYRKRLEKAVKHCSNLAIMPIEYDFEEIP